MKTIWKINTTSDAFLRFNETHLLENESINNMILGNANAIRKYTREIRITSLNLGKC